MVFYMFILLCTIFMFKRNLVNILFTGYLSFCCFKNVIQAFYKRCAKYSLYNTMIVNRIKKKLKEKAKVQSWLKKLKSISHSTHSENSAQALLYIQCVL